MPDYTLYVGTNRSFLKGRNLYHVIEDILRGGATLVQLREKEISAKEFFETGKKLLTLTRSYDVPLIINDRVDVMLALDAEGVHIGENDLPLPDVRRIAARKIVGYTVHNIEELRYAEKNGADYAGVGPVFRTATKSVDAPALGLEGLRRLTERSRIPCVAIGGINAGNVSDVASCGVTGCCVIGAVLQSDNPGLATLKPKKAITTAWK